MLLHNLESNKQEMHLLVFRKPHSNFSFQDFNLIGNPEMKDPLFTLSCREQTLDHKSSTDLCLII